MKTQIDMVLEFHQKHGFPIGEGLTTGTGRDSIWAAGWALVCLAKEHEHVVEEHPNHDVHRRVSLMIEELGETLQAISNNDETEILDGLVDTLYVIFGTIIALWGTNAGRLIELAFAEVQRSNMTKNVRKKGDPRLRTKGSDYDPPDLDRLLRRHHIEEASCIQNPKQ